MKHSNSEDHTHHTHHSHHHGHSHGPKVFANSAANAFALTLALNLAFVLVEFIGAYFTESLAIAADVVHDAGDCLSLAVAWGLQRIALRHRDENFSYGYGRFSLLAAVISGTAVFVSSLGLLFFSLPKIFQPGAPHGMGMLLFAILGIAVNGAGAWWLSRGDTISHKVLLWHYVEDVLGWVAVLLGGIGVALFEWHWLDPVLAAGIAIFVLRGVWRQMRTVLPVFLQAVPADIDLLKLQQQISAHAAVQELHDLHLWSLDGQNHILSLHLVLRDKSTDESALKQEIRALVRDFGKIHVTIELERSDGPCNDVC